MLKKYSLLIVFVVILLTSSTVFAQVTPPGGHVPPPNPTPIDGGLGALLLLGIGYAVKKLRKEDS